VYVTFVTLECVRARVWLSPSLRSVGACVWPWLPERVVVVHIEDMYYRVYYSGRRALRKQKGGPLPRFLSATVS
jgi:hypothetical protein